MSHCSDEEIDVVSVNVITIEVDDPMTGRSSNESSGVLKQKGKTLISMKDTSEIKRESSDEDPCGSNNDVGDSIESVLVNAMEKSNSKNYRSAEVRGNTLYDLNSCDVVNNEEYASDDASRNSARIIISKVNESVREEPVTNINREIVVDDSSVNSQWEMTGSHFSHANGDVRLMEIRTRFTNEIGQWGPWMNVARINENVQRGRIGGNRVVNRSRGIDQCPSRTSTMIGWCHVPKNSNEDELMTLF